MTENDPGIPSPGQGPDIQRGVYTKPFFPFEQQEFDGTEEVADEDRRHVLKTFERTVDGLRNNAAAEGQLRRQRDGNTIVESGWGVGSDGRPISFNIYRNMDQEITRRELILYWYWRDRDSEENSTYDVSYTSEVPHVRREDNRERLLPQASHPVNTGPVGRQEMNGVRRYVRPPRAPQQNG